VRGHLDLWRRVWITKVERREANVTCHMLVVSQEIFPDSARLVRSFQHLRLQSFSFRLHPIREINGYGCLNSITNYIRLIYSIYTVAKIYLFFSVVTSQLAPATARFPIPGSSRKATGKFTVYNLSTCRITLNSKPDTRPKTPPHAHAWHQRSQ